MTHSFLKATVLALLATSCDAPRSAIEDGTGSRVSDVDHGRIPDPSAREIPTTVAPRAKSFEELNQTKRKAGPRQDPDDFMLAQAAFLFGEPGSGLPVPTLRAMVECREVRSCLQGRAFYLEPDGRDHAAYLGFWRRGESGRELEVYRNDLQHAHIRPSAALSQTLSSVFGILRPSDLGDAAAIERVETVRVRLAACWRDVVWSMPFESAPLTGCE